MKIDEAFAHFKLTGEQNRLLGMLESFLTGNALLPD